MSAISDKLVGTTLAGKYIVKRLIGTGGMGAVFEGEHIEIGKRVAIKVIDPSHAGSQEVAARFRREARAASAVESDNIVQVFDVGQDPNAGLYMVMEYLTGEDLSGRLQRETRLDVQVAVSIGFQAARALSKAHGAGVVHRDLKPANLFLLEREDGSLHVKVLDFGISKLNRDEAPSQRSEGGGPKAALTRAGVVIGTPQYMSPEQAQGLPLDHRTDVWSLGAVLYEALAGQSAYAEMPTYEQTIIQIVMNKPRPLRDIAPWIPPELAEVIHGALAHDMSARITDCATFARRLVQAVPVTGLGASGRLSAPGAERTSDPLHRPPTPQIVIRAASSGSITSATKEALSSTLAGPGAPARTPAVGATLDLLTGRPVTGGTATGVAVGAGIPGLPPPRPRAVLYALGAVGALAVIILGTLAVRSFGSKSAVIEPPSQGLAVSAGVGAAPTASSLAAPEPASLPSAEPAAVAPSSSAAPTVAAVSPHAPPPKQTGKTPPTGKPPSGPAPGGQYGAAGVSTAY